MKKKIYLKNTKYTVELGNVKIYFILTKMTLYSYYISREEVRIFPQIALSSRIKSSKISQNYAVRNMSDKSLIKNQGTLLMLFFGSMNTINLGVT